jgi:hypothetical protein
MEIRHLGAPLCQQPVRPGEGLPLLIKLNPETLLLAKELGLIPRPPLELLKQIELVSGPSMETQRQEEQLYENKEGLTSIVLV